jgi:hypothetical protein
MPNAVISQSRIYRRLAASIGYEVLWSQWVLFFQQFRIQGLTKPCPIGLLKSPHLS